MCTSVSQNSLTAQSIAELVGGKVVGDGSTIIDDLAPLDKAGSTHLSFLANPKYRQAFLDSSAAVVLVAAAIDEASCTQIVCPSPYLAMAQVSTALYPPYKPQPGIHAGAHVHSSATVDSSASVLAGAVVDADAVVGAGSIIDALSYVGRSAILGKNVVLHPGAKVLERCELGDNVILHAGVVIGSDGFGYAPDAKGKRHKIPQVGRVVVESDVEIGANTTVDRATFGITRIGRGTKLDNLVQIAHNVEIGSDCVIASQSGVAGSAQLGDRLVVGAQVGITGHLQICDDVMLGGRTGVTSTIKEKGVYSGVPAMPHKQWLRSALTTKYLPQMRRDLASLRREVERLVSSD